MSSKFRQGGIALEETWRTQRWSEFFVSWMNVARTDRIFATLMAMLMVNAWKMHCALTPDDLVKYATCQDFIAAAAMEMITNPGRRDSHRGEPRVAPTVAQEQSPNRGTGCSLQLLPRNAVKGRPYRRCKVCHDLTRYACFEHRDEVPVCGKLSKGCFMSHSEVSKRPRHNSQE